MMRESGLERGAEGKDTREGEGNRNKEKKKKSERGEMESMDFV